MTESSGAGTAWVGQAIERLEDDTLLRGAGRYADDLGLAPGTLHAAFVRSPHAHARIESIDITGALATDGVTAVWTGADLARLGKPFITGVKARWAL